MNIVLTELYPLNRGKPARARRSDSSTSHNAAARTEADYKTHYQRQAIRAAVSFADGATAKELVTLTGIEYYTVQKRLSEVPGLFKTDAERDGCKVWKSV